LVIVNVSVNSWFLCFVSVLENLSPYWLGYIWPWVLKVGDDGKDVEVLNVRIAKRDAGKLFYPLDVGVLPLKQLQSDKFRQPFSSL
jgi:hypothetical protein